MEPHVGVRSQIEPASGILQATMARRREVLNALPSFGRPEGRESPHSGHSGVGMGLDEVGGFSAGVGLADLADGGPELGNSQ